MNTTDKTRTLITNVKITYNAGGSFSVSRPKTYKITKIPDTGEHYDELQKQILESELMGIALLHAIVRMRKHDARIENYVAGISEVEITVEATNWKVPHAESIWRAVTEEQIKHAVKLYEGKLYEERLNNSELTKLGY